MAQKQMKILSFWSINAGVELEPLRRQLAELRAHGIEGVVFHPRFYPGHPDYMSDEFIGVVSALILYAREIGMEFWLYDENGWPSGSADGQVLAAHPDATRQWIAAVPENEIGAADTVLCRHAGQAVVCRSVRGVSPLCRKTTDTFLQLTHERYRRKLAPAAFDAVTGFFCDEVEYFHGNMLSDGGAPWCEDFSDAYRRRYGEAPDALLWQLFTPGSEYGAFKIRFWETAAQLLAENFYQPYEQWCERSQKLFTAHLKAEENPYFQLMFSGSCFTQLKNISLPAVDTLERFPGNHFFPNILPSLEAQYGRSGTLAEAMGGAGWGVTPEDLRRYLLWLADSGIDRIVLHIAQYRLIANAIRDWPPSVPLHLTWHEGFADTLREIRKEAAPRIEHCLSAEKTLIVTPTRGVMAAYDPRESGGVNLHNGTEQPDTPAARISDGFMELAQRCHEAGLSCHFTEERELAAARVCDGRLCVGQASYAHVILAEGCVFTAEEQKVVGELRRAGLLTSVPVAPATRETAASPAACLPEQSGWEITAPAQNQLLLSLTAQDGVLTAELENRGYTGPLKLICTDEVAQVRVNGEIVAGDLITAAAANHEFLLPCRPHCRIEITPLRERQPFAFVRGGFGVYAAQGFSPFDERHLCCRGDFYINALGALHGGDLLSQGLPFAGEPVRARKTFRTEHETDALLTFDQILADAAEVTLDGAPLGWWWKERPLPVRLCAGEHTVELRAAGSTFNVYGPHRYYLGDYKLISSLAYAGVKSYCDENDAPEHTHLDTLQFVRFSVDGAIILLKKGENDHGSFLA